MGRVLLAIGAALLGAVAGLGGAYWLWGRQAVRVPALEQQVQSLQSELGSNEAQRRDLEQRVEQISKEQDRLAQQNTLLRNQQTTDRLLAEQQGVHLPTPVPIPK